MANTQTKAKDLRGPSIYQGEKAGTVFYDIFCKDGYIIQNSDAQKYDDYKTYLVLAIILAIATGLYGKFHYLITLGIIVVIIAIGRFIFQKKCLDGCAAIDYKPAKKESFIVEWSRTIKLKNMIIIIVLTIFMLILCLYNIQKYADEEFVRVGYILMSVGTAIFLVLINISLVIKLKNKSH